MTKPVRVQSIVLNDFCNFPRMEVLTRGVTPSWKRYGDGAKFFSAYFTRKSVEITAAEHSYGEGGKTTSKEVMLTLDLEAARQLHVMLTDMLAKAEA